MTMDSKNATRRQVLTTAAAAFTTSLFTGNVKGANDRVAIGFIGLGAMGSGNLGYAMKVPEAQPVALCDVYEPHLERAQAAAAQGRFPAEGASRDFREIIADKSIDAVCISTPDHWHAYMMVEACKAGKDVYVEKPVLRVRRGRPEDGRGGAQVQTRRAGRDDAALGRLLQESRGDRRQGVARRGDVRPHVPERRDQAGRLRQSARQRSRRRPQLGYVARTRAEGPVQHEPLGRQGHDLPDLPLLLGLCGRRDDGLGRAPDRPGPPVLPRSDADRDRRRSATSSTSRTTRKRRTRWRRRSTTRSSC